MQSASEQVIPGSMVAYGPDHPDYPNAPKDWDESSPVMLTSGFMFRQCDQHQPIYWGHDHDDIDSDVVAYTPLPSPAPMVEQAGEDRTDAFARCGTCGGEFDRGEWGAATECPECEQPKFEVAQSDMGALRAAWAEYGSYMGDPEGKDDTETAFFHAAAVIARHRLNTRPAPAETGGKAPETFWMIELNDGSGWLASKRGATSSVAADCLRFDCIEDANNVRNGLPQSLWLKFKTDPTEHTWIASTPPADAGMLREALEEAAGWFEQYAVEHYARAKVAPDAREQHSREIKGKTNADRAKHLRAALNSQAHQIREGENG